MAAEMKAEASDAKKRRYDRQLRLWGEHGQRAMEECSICLLNGSATGTETLKNLVLPGIGAFTVVDGATVSERDLGNNFFLDESCLGKPRAQCVTEMLKELNEFVMGSYIAEDISEVLAARPEFLHAFTLVIATQMEPAELKSVAAICAARKLPMLVVHTYGFLGYLRLDLGEHQVIETHPDHPFPDIRILHPPATLRTYVDTHYSSLDALDSKAFAHTPWAVLLIKAVDAWKAANGGALPTAYQAKKEVKALVEGLRRPSVQNDANLSEALAAINTALNVPVPSGSVAKLLSSARAKLSALVADQRLSSLANPSAEDAGGALNARKSVLAFWLMAAAVERFVGAEGGGLLPMIGTIPDMTAETETYVALQQIYAAQSASDVAAVQSHAREIAAVEGVPADLVDLEELKRFCKNAHAVTLVSYGSLAAEWGAADAGASSSAADAPAPPEGLGAALEGALSNDFNKATADGAALYVLLRAAMRFRAERSRWPGAIADAAEDVTQLRMCVAEAAREMGLPPLASGATSPVSEELVAEFCRWGGAEIHAVAAVMGGVASQEVIKAATHQYLPLNNTFIFNGRNGTTATLEL
jgi:NEDD8-activating enzyme E1 regulatory subunit